MNTLRYWKRDGFVFPHRLLFMTQGYSPWIRLFDATDLDAHALSSVYLKDGHLVQRVYYSHYPSLFLVPLIPLALLTDLGSPIPFQIFQLAVSGLAVLLLYLVIFRLYRSRLAASVAAAVFLFSNLFIKWATTLTNQPIDDLLRYAFMLAVLSESAVLAWFLLFGLSMVSLDSIFFCFIWLVGLDLLNNRRLRLRRWFVFGLGPVAARIIQLYQTASVYGFRDALLDQRYSFFQRSSLDSSLFFIIKRHMDSWAMEWMTVVNLERFFLSNAIRYLVFIPLVLIAAGLTIAFFRRRLPEGLTRKEIGYPIVLLFAGLAFGALVPVAGGMRYQGRQIIPFVCVSIALIIVYYERARVGWKDKLSTIPAVWLLAATALFSTVIVAGGVKTLAEGSVKPVLGSYPPDYVVKQTFAKDLHRVGDNRTTLVFLFDPDGKFVVWDRTPAIDTFRYQMEAIHSLEADKMILGFNSEAQLIEEAGKLRNRTGDRLRPLIVGRSAEEAERLARDEWRVNCRDPQSALSALAIGGWFGVLSPACSPG